jgi:hypothetical protein
MGIGMVLGKGLRVIVSQLLAFIVIGFRVTAAAYWLGCSCKAVARVIVNPVPNLISMEAELGVAMATFGRKRRFGA